MEIYNTTWWGNAIDTAITAGTEPDFFGSQMKLLTGQPELVTNGDFATDSDWTKQTGWSISNGVANYDFTSDVKYIRQTLLNGGFVSGKTYRINFEITTGTAYMYINSNGGGLISLNTYSVGSYSLYTTASVNGSDLLIYGRNTGGTAFSIDNVSVKLARAEEVEAVKCLADWIHTTALQDLNN